MRPAPLGGNGQGPPTPCFGAREAETLTKIHFLMTASKWVAHWVASPNPIYLFTCYDKIRYRCSDQGNVTIKLHFDIYRIELSDVSNMLFMQLFEHTHQLTP